EIRRVADEGRGHAAVGRLDRRRIRRVDDLRGPWRLGAIAPPAQQVAKRLVRRTFGVDEAPVGAARCPCLDHSAASGTGAASELVVVAAAGILTRNHAAYRAGRKRRVRNVAAVRPPMIATAI